MAYLAFGNGMSALALAAGCTLTLWVTTLSGRAQARIGRERMAVRQAQRGRLAEMVAGVSSLRAHDATGGAISRWRGLLRGDILATMHLSRVSAVADAACALANRSVWAIAVLTSAWAVTKGESGMGTAAASILMVATAMEAAFAIGQQWVSARVEMAAVSRIDAVIKERAVEPRAVDASSGPIILRGVGFRYALDLPWVLRDLDLTIKEEETVWLKSPSGSGKSTLMRLMAGLVEPTIGKALVGGVPIHGTNMPIGYLPQCAELVDDSIMANLGVLSGNASRSRILAVAEATGLSGLVDTLPMGYSTRATGATFSGGQRQLILLTGVLARGARILLLDEPMANMDWAMRQRVRPLLRESGNTVVYVSHDIPLDEADRVIALRPMDGANRPWLGAPD